MTMLIMLVNSQLQDSFINAISLVVQLICDRLKCFLNTQNTKLEQHTHPPLCLHGMVFNYA
jgi:hypothetical protein